jgi:hypothetical protein
MTIINPIFDHIAQALEVLLSQFADSPRLQAFIEVLLTQVQELEDEANAVLSTSLDNSEGDALDQYGALVGEPRDGLSDEEYRKFILVRIRANRSNGNPEVIAGILADLSGGAVKYRLLYPASYALDYQLDQPGDASLRSRWVKVLESVTPAGVLLAEVVESGPNAFGFEGDETALGFGEGEFNAVIINA